VLQYDRLGRPLDFQRWFGGEAAGKVVAVLEVDGDSGPSLLCHVTNKHINH